MPRLLQINASLFANQGHSSQLAERYVAAWRHRHADAEVVVRDLASAPLPHLDAARFQAFITPAAERDSRQREIVAESDALIAELRAADVIVLGLPMYNFGIPSQLKSWFDHIARAGETFRYTANGPQGLLENKRAVVLATRGGVYAGTPLDTQSQYLRDFLRFIGVTDVEFVYAEGLNLGEERRRDALAAADAAIARLARPAAARLAA